MTIGIYALKFKGTDKLYIGQSICIEDRYSRHLTRIRAGIANYKLQEAYKQYGEPYLEILITTDNEKELDNLENETISKYNAVENGLNIRSKAGGGGRGLYGEKHGASKYSNDQILDVFEQLLLEHKSFNNICIDTGVSIHTIRDISKGTSHRWIRDIYPSKYEELLNRVGTRSKNTLEDQRSNKVFLTSPEGLDVLVTNISEFARINKLNKSHLSGVINGIRKSHLGWKLKAN